MIKAFSQKRIWTTLGITAACILIIILALPLVASTQIVSHKISQQLTSWSGYTVRLEQPPELKLWPRVQAVLTDVALLDLEKTKLQPILEADRIELDLSALAALRGEVSFKRIRLVRPVINISNFINADEGLELENNGLLARSVKEAKDATTFSNSKLESKYLSTEALGTIELVDARIVAEDNDKIVDVVSSLTGQLDWPALNRQAKLTATGIWRGESVTLTASSPAPLLLLSGTNAPIDIVINSTPLTVTYNGEISLQNEGLFDGEIAFDAPSFKRVVEWVRGEAFSGGRRGPFALSAEMTGSTKRVKLKTSKLAIDTSVARGQLDISFTEPRPMLSGTLAFDMVNLQTFIKAIIPLPSKKTAAEPNISTDWRVFPLARLFDVDLRLSATSASYGMLTLNNIAAAARSNNQFSSFDISDATLFGGEFQINLKTTRAAYPPTTEVRLNSKNVETSKLAVATPFEELNPQGPASISLQLKGTGSDMDTFLKTAKGDISVNFGPGILPGINFQKLFHTTGDRIFFPLSELKENNEPWSGIKGKAKFSNGIAHLELFEAAIGSDKIIASGLTTITGRSLALLATLETPTEPEKLDFFIGGSWDAPFLSSPAQGLNPPPYRSR